MAATVSIPSSHKLTVGGGKIGVADVTMDSSYPTGGESLDPTDFGLSEVWHVLASPANGYIPIWDYVNVKLKVYAIKVYHDAAPGDAIALDAGGTRIEGTLTGTADVDLVLEEIEAATDLSAVKFRITMIGA